MANEAFVSQINTRATDRNCKQTKRICELRGWDLWWFLNGKVKQWGITHGPETVILANGSFTLDQVVGMLEKRNLEWVSMKAVCDGCGYYGPSGWFNEEQELIGAAESPHDLTAAMNTLIIYEEKQREAALSTVFAKDVVRSRLTPETKSNGR